MKTLFTAATAVCVSSMAFGAVADLDADGDGVVSFAEMLVMFPTMTEDGFTAVDLNGDGFVDEAELAAAEEGGLIPATSG
ncbi:MAG: hypothetical protein AAGA12_09295 [Pseudomonadota bacterium]